MRATVMYRLGDVRIESVPDAEIIKPTDALIQILRGCICGSDLWPYNDLEPKPKKVATVWDMRPLVLLRTSEPAFALSRPVTS